MKITNHPVKTIDILITISISTRTPVLQSVRLREDLATLEMIQVPTAQIHLQGTKTTSKCCKAYPQVFKRRTIQDTRLLKNQHRKWTLTGFTKLTKTSALMVDKVEITQIYLWSTIQSTRTIPLNITLFSTIQLILICSKVRICSTKIVAANITTMVLVLPMFISKYPTWES